MTRNIIMYAKKNANCNNNTYQPCLPSAGRGRLFGCLHWWWGMVVFLFWRWGMVGVGFLTTSPIAFTWRGKGAIPRVSQTHFLNIWYSSALYDYIYELTVIGDKQPTPTNPRCLTHKLKISSEVGLVGAQSGCTLISEIGWAHAKFVLFVYFQLEVSMEKL